MAEHGTGARIIAGGQSLIPLMNARVIKPSVVVDIGKLDSLRYIRAEAGTIRLGALTRLQDLEYSAELARLCALFLLSVPYIADRQVRARGTFGGSLAFADPSAELPLLCVALDAEIHMESTAGPRVVPATSFFKQAFKPSMTGDEIVTEARFEAPSPEAKFGFVEISRRHADPALASAAVILRLAPDGSIVFARLALGAVAETPLRAFDIEAALLGERITSRLLDEVEDQARRLTDPMSDVNGSAEYRRHLAGIVARCALNSAVRRE